MTLRLKLVAFVQNSLYDNTLNIQEYVHSLEHMWSKKNICGTKLLFLEFRVKCMKNLKGCLKKTYKLENPVCVHLLFTDLSLLNNKFQIFFLEKLSVLAMN